MKNSLILFLFSFILVGCGNAQSNTNATKKTTMESGKEKKNEVYNRDEKAKVNLSNEDWKKILDPEVYYIARQKGTERPWTSKFEDFKEKGTYYCAACGNSLFQSDTKFESGCGWPSFYEPISKKSIIYTPDNTLGMKRTEVQCGRCEAHLGHVFEDGPPPTGLRYCINGVILDFEKAQSVEKNYQKKKGSE